MQSDEAIPRTEKRSVVFHLLAPADGRLMPLPQHPEAIHRLQLAGPGFWLQLQSDTLCTPCDGIVSIQYTPSFCIRLKHPTGLQTVLELPAALLSQHGKGLFWCCHDGASIKAGEPLLRFDPAFLTQTPPLTLTLLLLPAKAIHAAPVVQAKMVSTRQPCFTFQLHGISL